MKHNVPDPGKSESECRSGLVSITENQETEIRINANHFQIERDIFTYTILTLGDELVVWVKHVVILRFQNQDLNL